MALAAALWSIAKLFLLDDQVKKSIVFLPNLWIKVMGLFNDNIESSKMESSELVVRPKIWNNFVQLCYSVKKKVGSLCCVEILRHCFVVGNLLTHWTTEFGVTALNFSFAYIMLRKTWKRWQRKNFEDQRWWMTTGTESLWTQLHTDVRSKQL